MLSELMTELVRSAPALPAATVDAALAALAAWRGDRALAEAIARVLQLVAQGRADATALPHLAMACETLCDPRLGERERAVARYEVETFLPVPDVTTDQLIRGPRPRT